MTVQVDRSHRLPASEYMAEPTAKSGIALHHTVCDSARTTLAIWRTDSEPGGAPRRVATAFVIDLDGTVYEAFDPARWAWQFGLKGWRTPDRVAFERRFIGIEITGEGVLVEQDGRLYVYDRANADSWRAQQHRLVAADSLHRIVVALQDSVARLLAANADAYRAGYEAAYAGYQDLSARYVAQLHKPRITLGRSIELIVAAGAGFLLGGVVRE